MSFGCTIPDDLSAEIRERHPDADCVFFFDSDHSIGHWVFAEVCAPGRDVIATYTRRSKFGRFLFDIGDDYLAAFTDKAFIDLTAKDMT